jgi:hypothetical protein
VQLQVVAAETPTAVVTAMVAVDAAKNSPSQHPKVTGTKAAEKGGCREVVVIVTSAVAAPLRNCRQWQRILQAVAKEMAAAKSEGGGCSDSDDSDRVSYTWFSRVMPLFSPVHHYFLELALEYSMSLPI